ncbi:MAG TPA: HlyD family secretion protein [Methylorubrum populi]|uniref:HlyD family secretion protein n=1 Tax=Methylorubrum populi TaxID=223967 RepID=A0A921JHK5_9HYPH|nr:HlyD family secretion protein [Methylorubrum populi]
MLDEQRQAKPADAPTRQSDAEGRDALDFQPDRHRIGDEGGKPDDEGRDSAAPDRDAGEGEPRRSILRRHPWWFVLGALAVLVLGAAGYAYWLIDLRPYESTDDAFVDARSFTIAPKVGGYVIDVPVTDNQHVKAGDTLFRIDPRDYRVALEQAEAQVQAAQAAIRNVNAQIEAQKAQIEVAKAQVETAQAALTFAQEDADRYKTLAARGAGTIQQSQSSTSTLQQRQAALTSAQANVIAAQRQIGSLQAQRASTEAQLAQMKAQRDQAELNLGYTNVTAAQAGRVVRLTGGVGEYAQPGQSLSMFVPDDIWVTANFKETQVTDIRPGQPVDIEIDAYPNRRITGHVASVQPGSGTAFSLLPAQNATGNYVKVTQRIPVKIVADDWPADVAIGPGMSVVPRVHVR